MLTKSIAAYFISICLLFSSASVLADGRLVFLDVDQGDAILLQSGQCNLLVDAGNLSTGAQLYSKLQHYGVKQLDYLIITHPHLDHFGGVFAFSRDFTIKQVLDNGANSPDWVYWDEYIKWRSGYDYSVLQRADQLQCGQTLVRALHPYKNQVKELDLNAGSLVLYLELDREKVVLASDIPASVEADLIKKTDNKSYATLLRKIALLKVGHHGSDAASSSDWLQYLQPKFAVISVGKNNRWQRPHKPVIDRLNAVGSTLLRTDIEGDVICSVRQTADLKGNLQCSGE